MIAKNVGVTAYRKGTKTATRDQIARAEFDAMMARGLDQARRDESRPASEVIADLRKDIHEWRK